MPTILPMGPPIFLDDAAVLRMNYNKRWTYSGSLTTAPCSEGILWNVVENVIPIRQETLDNYVKMRVVQE